MRVRRLNSLRRMPVRVFDTRTRTLGFWCGRYSYSYVNIKHQTWHAGGPIHIRTAMPDYPLGATPFLGGSCRSPKARWELPQTCIHQNARRSEPHAAVLRSWRALQARAR